MLEKNYELNKDEAEEIINITCPCESDILADAIEVLKEKNVEISIFFAQCNLTNLQAIFALLHKQINIYLAQCPNTLISPHVIECMKNDFNIKIVD